MSASKSSVADTRVMLCVGRCSQEWEFMWRKLAEHKDNRNNKEPEVCEYLGEAWQYMGTSKVGEGFVHSFRHRNHPARFGFGHHIQVGASELFNPTVDC